MGAGFPTRREHRTVVLPDYQGIGIGMAVSSTIASLWKALGNRATSTTTHPAFTAARKRSLDWQLTRPPGFTGVLSTSTRKKRAIEKQLQHSTTRLTTGFEYVGPPMDIVTAQKLLNM